MLAGTVHGRRARRYALGLLLLPAFCSATEVYVVGVRTGRGVDLVIGRHAPIKVDVGETVAGVKVLRVDTDGAVLSIDGKITALPLVAPPASLRPDAAGTSVTLSADARGQFFTAGVVNGRSMQFLVDTGATAVTLSRADARRINLDYREGASTSAVTVNGVVRGWRVTLDSVRIGRVTERDVEAVVVDNDSLPIGLLGASFLDRFDMRRDGATLVLRQRR